MLEVNRPREIPANDVPQIGANAGRATDTEILRQSLDKVVSSIDQVVDRMDRRDHDAMRRSQQTPPPPPPVVHAPPPPPPPASSGPKVPMWVTVLLAFASPIVTLAGGGYFMTSYWRGQDATDARFKAIEAEQSISKAERIDLKNEVKQQGKDIEGIRKERDALKLARDEQYKGLEARLEKMQDFGLRIGQIEGRQEKTDRTIETGRGERLADRERMSDKINDLNTRQRLLEQGFEGGRGRRPEPSPFGGQNQMWIVPPLSPAVNPFIQRATFFPIAEPARRAAPLRAAARPVAKRRIRRAPTLIVRFTRAVERAFGKPRAKRRAWP